MTRYGQIASGLLYSGSPSLMKGRIVFGATLFAAGLLFTACQSSKYAGYTSIWGDYRCAVPRGWQVITERDKGDFTNTNFVGPFEPGFLLGVPSMSVRWHAYNAAHRLPDGQLELYSNVDDYIQQTLRDVYQPNLKLVNNSGKVDEKTLNDRPARYFVASSPERVPSSLKWGTVIDADSGLPYNIRQHAYWVLPGERGFYVLIYPATKEGYPLYEKQFNQLASSFAILKDGPDGPESSSAARKPGGIPVRRKLP